MTTFNWPDFIKLAKEMLSSGPTDLQEAIARTSISRSYYGAYKQACNAYFKQTGDNPALSDNSHKIVIDYYSRSTETDEKKIGNLLERLKRLRIYSDYDNVIQINSDDAIVGHGMAEKASRLIGKIG